MALKDTVEETLLDYILANEGASANTFYIALYLSDPTDNTEGSEVPGGAYARQSVTLSRTAQTADITIVDNVIRGMRLLISACKKAKTKKVNFNNKKALASALSEIKNNLKRRTSIA